IKANSTIALNAILPLWRSPGGRLSREYQEVVSNQSYRIRLRIGAAINAKIGIWRTERSAAQVVTAKSSSSRGDTPFFESASAARRTNSIDTSGRYFAWWKSGENHSAMYACMARERRVSK